MTENVVDLIRSRYSAMTKKQKLLADYMLREPESMAFITLKELAAKVQVSEMTILKACSVLDCGNYNELKYEFRKYLSLRSKIEVQQANDYAIAEVPDYELSHKERLLRQICQEERAATDLFFSSLDAEALFRGAQMMLEASNTVICGRGVSFQATEFLSMRLATLGLPSVTMNTEHNDAIQAALPLLGSAVLTVAISLPDYYLMTTKVCEFAKQRHSPILCLTDSPQSPIAPFGDLVLTAPASTRLFLNTLGPMMALINLLTSALNIEKSSRKSGRFSSAQDFGKLFS